MKTPVTITIKYKADKNPFTLTYRLNIELPENTNILTAKVTTPNQTIEAH